MALCKTQGILHPLEWTEKQDILSQIFRLLLSATVLALRSFPKSPIMRRLGQSARSASPEPVFGLTLGNIGHHKLLTVMLTWVTSITTSSRSSHGAIPLTLISFMTSRRHKPTYHYRLFQDGLVWHVEWVPMHPCNVVFHNHEGWKQTNHLVKD